MTTTHTPHLRLVHLSGVCTFFLGCISLNIPPPPPSHTLREMRHRLYPKIACQTVQESARHVLHTQGYTVEQHQHAEDEVVGKKALNAEGGREIFPEAPSVAGPTRSFEIAVATAHLSTTVASPGCDVSVSFYLSPQASQRSEVDGAPSDAREWYENFFAQLDQSLLRTPNSALPTRTTVAPSSIATP